MSEYIPTTTQTNQVVITPHGFGDDENVIENFDIEVNPRARCDSFTDVFDELNEVLSFTSDSIPSSNNAKSTTINTSNTTSIERPATPVTNQQGNKFNNNKRSRAAISVSNPAASQSKIESHRAATAKRKRQNGRFQSCQVEWINVNLLGEKET
jgi:hypothetical protein